MNEAPFRCSTLGQAHYVTHKHSTRSAIFASETHSKLLRKSVIYGQKKFYNFGPWLNFWITEVIDFLVSHSSG